MKDSMEITKDMDLSQMAPGESMDENTEMLNEEESMDHVERIKGTNGKEYLLLGEDYIDELRNCEAGDLFILPAKISLINCGKIVCYPEKNDYFDIYEPVSDEEGDVLYDIWDRVKADSEQLDEEVEECDNIGGPNGRHEVKTKHKQHRPNTPEQGLKVDSPMTGSINEYGDNYNYPIGADNSSAPWNQVDAPTEILKEDWPFNTYKFLVFTAEDNCGIEDETQLDMVKDIASRLPEKIYVHGVFEVPYRWENLGGGESEKEYDYSNSNDGEISLCIHETKGEYIPLVKWAEEHQVFKDEEESNLLKKIVDAFDFDVEDEGVGIQDFFYGSEYSYFKVLDEYVNRVPGPDNQVNEEIDEKAVSKAQQRFFGIVRARQKGELDADEVSKSVNKAAKSMSKKDVKDFAETKHKGLPNHVDEEEEKAEKLVQTGIVKLDREGIKKIIGEELKKLMEESIMDDGNYTHFAVNKATNKIVNGWDYHGYDSEQLKQFKDDYFFTDLRDNDLNPKDYVILNYKTCLRRGIDPDDESQWAQS